MPPVAIQSSSAEAIDVPPVQSSPTEVEAIDVPPVQSSPTEVEAIDVPPVQSSPTEVEAIDVPPVQSSPTEVEAIDVPPVQSSPAEVEAIDVPPVQSSPAEVEAIDVPPVQSSPAEVEAIDVPPVQSSPAEVEAIDVPPVQSSPAEVEAIDVPPVQSSPAEVEAIDVPPVQSSPAEVEAIDVPPVQSSPAEVEAIDVPPVQSSPSEVETSADSLILSALVPPTSPPPQSLSGVSSGMIGVSGFCSSGSDTENESTSNICIDKCDDIGLLLRSMPQTSICNLPPEKKYSIFVNHFRPGESYKFPSRPLDGCNRACQYKYLKSNPHFVYSKAEDGIYCLPCALFANSSDFSLGQFVREKFNHWTKKNLRFSSHNSKQYHQVSLTRVESLKHSINVPSPTIDMHITKISSEDIARNQLIIKFIADAVLFCGRQNIALRGHRDDRSSEECNNRGNFLALLDYGIKSGNETLKKHLEEAKRNAVYTSKTTQNQLIECIGDHIRDGILKDIKLAKWYSILQGRI